MPRKKRSERLHRARPQPAAAVLAEPTNEARHLKCPLCGLMAREEFFRQGPYVPIARLQHFGGYSRIEWDAPEPITAEDLATLRHELREALEILERGVQ